MTSQSHALVKVMTSNVLSAIQVFGFDIDNYEKQSKQTLNNTAFCKPNPKAFEVVAHFLLTQIDSERSQKVFSKCWPPILKEQQKDFKDTMFNWLLEIASPLKQQKENVNMVKFQQMLLYIKFPNITKSLLMTPGGLKICELLFALSQYMVLLRLLKLIDGSKLVQRVLPKVSPLTVPPNLALSNNTYEANKQSTAKFLSQKQLVQFEMHCNALKNRIDFELNEFDFLLTNLINVRGQWLQFSQEMINNIRVLIEKKAQLGQSLARKKARLAQQLKLNKDQTASDYSLEDIYRQFNEFKLVHFEQEWSKFMSVKNNSTEDEFKKREITRLTNGETENLELNGNDFIHGVKNSETGESNEDIINRILQHAFENAALRNTKVGDIFYENGTKLDLVNLIRLYSIVLILKGENYSKIDQAKLSNLTGLLGSDEKTSDQLFKTNWSMSSKLQTFLASKSRINEHASAIKGKLDVYLPKIEEKCGNLLEDEWKQCTTNNEQIGKENATYALVCDHFALRKQTLKETCLQYIENFKEDIKSDSSENQENLDDNNKLEFTCLPNECTQLDGSNENFGRSGQSFQLLDLSEEMSNLELI